MNGQTKNKLLKEEDPVNVFDLFLNSRLENVHTSCPGMIETYVEGERKAKVKLLVNLVRKNGDVLENPVINDVPVQFPSAASFSLTYPLAKGDKGLIVFAETGIGGYLSGNGAEAEADSPARFQLTDAIFIPGVVPFSKATKGAASISIDAGKNVTVDGASLTLNGSADVQLNGVSVKLNGSTDVQLNGSSDNAVLFSELKTVVDELQADITILKAAFAAWVVVALDGGAALKTATAAWYAAPLITNIDNSKSDTVKLT